MPNASGLELMGVAKVESTKVRMRPLALTIAANRSRSTQKFNGFVGDSVTTRRVFGRSACSIAERSPASTTLCSTPKRSNVCVTSWRVRR
jgi:hypothetical protein